MTDQSGFNKERKFGLVPLPVVATGALVCCAGIVPGAVPVPCLEQLFCTVVVLVLYQEQPLVVWFGQEGSSLTRVHPQQYYCLQHFYSEVHFQKKNPTPAKGSPFSEKEGPFFTNI